MTDPSAAPPTNAPSTYPNRIRELRLASGAPLRSIADASGISIQQINRLELGQRRLTDDARAAIAKALGVHPADLDLIATQEEPPPPAIQPAPIAPPQSITPSSFTAAYTAIGIGAGDPIATARGFEEGDVKPGMALEVPVSSLVRWPLNPRRDPAPAAIEELAESIALQGVLQPLLTRRVAAPGSELEVIAGERRRLAIALLIQRGRLLRDFPVPVRVVALSDTEALFAAGAENLARQGMHPLDETELFAALIAQGFEKAKIAARLGTSVRTVERRLFLANLVDQAKEMFRAGELSQAQAEALAGGSEQGQRDALAMEQITRWTPGMIRDVSTQQYPSEDDVAFDLDDYERRGGALMEEDGFRTLVTLDLARTMQAEAIADVEAELKAEFAWVDRVSVSDPTFYSLGAAGSYRRVLRSHVTSEDQIGALIVTDKDGWQVNVFRSVARPAAAAPEPQQIEMFAGQARGEADEGADGGDEDGEDEAGGDEGADAPDEPKQPDEPDARDGEAARLMTADQIKAVRAVQSKALRQAIAQYPKAALAHAILIHLEAVPALRIQTPHYERAPDEKAELTEAVIKLAAIWDGAPDPNKINYLHDLSHWFRQNEFRAPDCYRALVEFADEAALLGLLAALTACRIASWHNDADRSPTSSVKPLTAAIARHVRADLFMTYHWRPDADYFKGYDRVGLKAALAAGEQNLSAFRYAGKNELIAACASLDGDATLGLPELAFMTSADQQDAVIEARGEVIAAERPAAKGAPSSDEEKEAA